MFYYYDPTYLLVIVGLVITLIAQGKLKSTYARYRNVRAYSGYTGAQVAKMILNANGIFDVSVQPIAGELTDHYDPTKKVLNLSQSVYGVSSIAALGVAAHECGHAIQDNTDYMPLKLRAAFVPAANLGSRLAMPLILVGLLLGYGSEMGMGGGLGELLIDIGLFAFLLAVLFQIITLPVEYNASSRALVQLRELNVLTQDEIPAARSVLSAAALTYVAAAASTVLQFLRLLLITRGNRRRN